MRKRNSLIAPAIPFRFAVLSVVLLCSIPVLAQTYDSLRAGWSEDPRLVIESADTLSAKDIVRKLFAQMMESYERAADSTKQVLDYEIISIVLIDEAARAYRARWIADIRFSVKPSKDSFMWWSAGNGHVSANDPWIRRKCEYYAVYEIDSTYVLYSMGTGIGWK